MARRRKKAAAMQLPTAGVSLPAPVAGGNPFSGARSIGIKVVTPSKIYNGRLENPDPVLVKHGSWEQICLYSRMLRQFPSLAGVCHLAADRVCAIDRAIKPGEPTEGRSREMADLTRSLYERIDDVHIVNKKMAMGRFFGFAATGKDDWRLDERTGLLAPHDLYDIPQQYLKFGPDGQVYALSERNPYGELIPQKDVFFYRWGSRFTPYGEGDFQDVYLTTWYYQNVRQLGMKGLEILTRPIPWIEIPSGISPEEYDATEAGVKAMYQYYVITRTNKPDVRVTFPSLNVLANGAAGKSELEYLAYLRSEMYIRILGVQMTQDSSGGSRALESTRLEVMSDKTPPASQALDLAWTKGWSDHIWSVNAPNEPRESWPRFDSDTSSAATVLNGAQITAVVAVGAGLVANQMTATYAEKTLLATGIPEAWASDMVKSMVEERATLAAPVAAAKPAAVPAGNPEPEEGQGNEAA